MTLAADPERLPTGAGPGFSFFSLEAMAPFGCCLRFPFVVVLAALGELDLNEERTGESARPRGPLDDDDNGSCGLVARERLLAPSPWTGCVAELARE